MHRHVLAASLFMSTLGALACGAEDRDALMRFGRHLAGECMACHRPDTADGAIPALAGRPETEIVGLLQDFRDGRKSNPVMISVAKSLDAQQSAALAAYFASLPAPPRSGSRPR